MKTIGKSLAQNIQQSKMIKVSKTCNNIIIKEVKDNINHKDSLICNMSKSNSSFSNNNHIMVATTNNDNSTMITIIIMEVDSSNNNHLHLTLFLILIMVKITFNHHRSKFNKEIFKIV